MDGGAPHGASLVEIGPGETLALDALLAQRPELLGASGQRYGELPFLMKVLSAAKPLSIQVHPTADQAKAWLRRRRGGGHPLESRVRCYPDVHHKPELIVALTDFAALSGFRRHTEAASELSSVQALAEERGHGGPALREVLSTVQDQLERQDYAAALEYILASGQKQSAEAARALHALVQETETAPDRLGSAAWDTLTRITEHFPGDPGILLAMLLNRVDLRPGRPSSFPLGIFTHTWAAPVWK